MTKKNPHAVALGKRGGTANTPAQQYARRQPKGGGRPSRYRLTAAGLDRLTDGLWQRLTPPYDAAARAFLRRTTRP